MKISLELIERFHEKWDFNKSTGCWQWNAATMGAGYGFIKIPKSRKQISAHRLSYLIHQGDIPDGKMVCHTCDNTRCVKPSHLFLGTQSDNLQDMKNKDRHLKGEKNKMSKLTSDSVRQIHKLSLEGLSQGKIANNFNISQSTVWKILKGLRWNHIYLEIRRVEGSDLN